MKGSYAGAMGIPQFISSSYRNYAVSLDQNKQVDLINDIDTAIASVANYFKSHGWKPGKNIVYKAAIKGDKYKNFLHDKIIKPKYTVAMLQKSNVKSNKKLEKSHKLALIELELEKNKKELNFQEEYESDHNGLKLKQETDHKELDVESGLREKRCTKSENIEWLGMDSNNSKDYIDNIVLTVKPQKNSLEYLEQFINDPDLINHVRLTEKVHFSLHHAIWKSDYFQVKILLLLGFDPQLENNDCHTPLDLTSGDPKMKLLIEDAISNFKAEALKAEMCNYDSDVLDIIDKIEGDLKLTH